MGFRNQASKWKSVNTNPPGRRGMALEAVVPPSQRGIIAVEKVQTASRRIRTPQGFQIVQTKSIVDWIGTVCGTGRAIFFDTKQGAIPTRLDVGPDHFPAHQRDFLIKMGQAGAVSGLLAEATDPSVAAYFWIDWTHLLEGSIRSFRWDDPRLTPLGPRTHCIRFEAIPTLKSA